MEPSFALLHICLAQRFLMKELELALDRKALCVGLLVLLAAALSPVAHAKAKDEMGSD